MAQWGWLESFANRQNYLLELKLWQDTPVKKGQKDMHNRRKPKPFIPPFMRQSKPEGDINKESEAMTVDDVKSWLSVPRG